MSTIAKQSPCAPKGKAPSAAALLAGAIKKGKTTSHLAYAGDAGREAATRWLELDAKLAETEREVALVREQVLDMTEASWHRTRAR